MNELESEVTMSQPAIQLFISYAHKDNPFFEVFKNGLISHLFTSARFDFGVWEDSKIHTGSLWDEAIQNSLGESEVAILCVSANFLNSRYITVNEFETLISRFPRTLIVPVYFNHCNIQYSPKLAQIQFFKPEGNRYGKGSTIDFSFCDLVKFRQTDGMPIQDASLDIYFQDLVANIESALAGRYDTQAPTRNVRTAQPAAEIAPSAGWGMSNGQAAASRSIDAIVTYIIIGFMILSAFLIFYLMLFKAWNTETMFKTSMGCVMFFGSVASFFFSKKNKPYAV